MSKIPLDSASKMVKIGIYTINWGGDNYYVWESTAGREKAYARKTRARRKHITGGRGVGRATDQGFGREAYRPPPAGFPPRKYIYGAGRHSLPARKSRVIHAGFSGGKLAFPPENSA